MTVSRTPPGRWPIYAEYRIERPETSIGGKGARDRVSATYLTSSSRAEYAVSLIHERGLVRDVRRLSGSESGILAFASEYGFPVIPARDGASYRVSLSNIAKELALFNRFDRRLQLLDRLEPLRSHAEREGLADDLSRYLDTHGVRIGFEALRATLPFTTIIFGGPPITVATLRLAMAWQRGGFTEHLAPRKCMRPDCPVWFTPKQRSDQRYHSDACRKAATRVRRRRDR